MLKRKDILKRISVLADATLRDSGIFLDAFLEALTEAFEEGESVHLRGFGNFEVKSRKPCKTYHPDTGEEVIIPSHKVCKFTQSQALRRRINGE